MISGDIMNTDLSSLVAFGALVVSALSLSFAITQFFVNRRDQRKAKMREQLIGSLDWFGKVVQECSIGISL
jgi:preprotein translocase subunit YajC